MSDDQVFKVIRKAADRMYNLSQEDNVVDFLLLWQCGQKTYNTDS